MILTSIFQTNLLQRKIRTLNLQGSYYSCLVHLQRALPAAKGAEHRERSLCSRSRVRGNDNKKIRTIWFVFSVMVPQSGVCLNFFYKKSRLC